MTIPGQTINHGFRTDAEAVLKHVEHLAGAIGPRASSSAGERVGHDYVRKTLEEIGCVT